MFGLISFGLKIIFASIIGGALNYIPDGKSENNHNIIETSLICIFSASVMGLTRQFEDNGQYILMGFGILSVVIVVISISKNLEFGKRISWIFASVIGMVIGSGFLIQACILSALIYLILRNSENILNYIHKESEEIADSSA